METEKKVITKPETKIIQKNTAKSAQKVNAKIKSINITLTRETNNLLISLIKEIKMIYWESIESKDDLILFLINYYYKK